MNPNTRKELPWVVTLKKKNSLKREGEIRKDPINKNECSVASCVFLFLRLLCSPSFLRPILSYFPPLFKQQPTPPHSEKASLSNPRLKNFLQTPMGVDLFTALDSN